MNLKNLLLFAISITLLSNCKPSETKTAELKTQTQSSFHSFDNIKIAYTDEGTGKPILLVHGFISSGSSWQNTALKKLLLVNGYRVIVPDLRGNGKSDKPSDEEAYKNNAEIKDLIALLDHLNIKSLTAIGYSRGSIVLAKLLTQESRIKKAVLGGMGVDFTNPNWDRRIAFADAFTGRAPLNEMTEGAVNYAKSIKADIQALGFLQDYQPVTSTEELNKIKIKTLVICGDEDLDNGSPQQLQSELPNSELIIVKGDHNNTYKQDNFAEAIISFL